jgi:hypothetical protein
MAQDVQKEMIMDNQTAKYPWALRKVNEALIEALKMAIFVLEKEEELSKERRRSLTESLKDLVAQCEEIYPEPPTQY